MAKLKKKIGFVTVGGGAKGSYEIGKMKALALQGIVPDAIFGTSTGAINAAGYAILGVDQTLAVWRSIKSINDVMIERFPLLLPYYLLFKKQTGVYSMAPLEKTINTLFTQEKFLRATIEAVVCRVSLKTSMKDYVSSFIGKQSMIPAYKKFNRAVVASASTPIMNDVVDGEWVDGGVRAIAPLSAAIKAGCTDIHVIQGEPFSQSCGFSGEVGNVIDVFNRTIGSMVQEMLWDDVHQCDIYNKNGIGRRINLTVWAPSVSLIGADEFDPVKIEASIQQGLHQEEPVFVTK